MSKVSIHETYDLPQDKFYSVVTDYEKYPEFLSEIKSAKLEKDSPKQVAFTLEKVKTFEYVLEFKEKAPCEISWKLVRSNLFKKNSGGWKFKPQGDRILVTYSLDVEFGFLVPSFIVNGLVKKDLPKVIEVFKERVEALYG